MYVPNIRVANTDATEGDFCERVKVFLVAQNCAMDQRISRYKAYLQDGLPEYISRG